MSKEKGNKCLLRDIEKNDYETKYNGNLTCPKWVFCQNYIYLEKCKYFNFLVHGIKGDVHDERCPYHVDNTGKVGRCEW